MSLKGGGSKPRTGAFPFSGSANHWPPLTGLACAQAPGVGSCIDRGRRPDWSEGDRRRVLIGPHRVDARPQRARTGQDAPKTSHGWRGKAKKLGRRGGGRRPAGEVALRGPCQSRKSACGFGDGFCGSPTFCQCAIPCSVHPLSVHTCHAAHTCPSKPRPCKPNPNHALASHCP